MIEDFPPQSHETPKEGTDTEAMTLDTKLLAAIDEAQARISEIRQKRAAQLSSSGPTMEQLSLGIKLGIRYPKEMNQDWDARDEDIWSASLEDLADVHLFSVAQEVGRAIDGESSPEERHRLSALKALIDEFIKAIAEYREDKDGLPIEERCHALQKVYDDFSMKVKAAYSRPQEKGSA